MLHDKYSSFIERFKYAYSIFKDKDTVLNTEFNKKAFTIFDDLHKNTEYMCVNDFEYSRPEYKFPIMSFSVNNYDINKLDYTWKQIEYIKFLKERTVNLKYVADLHQSYHIKELANEEKSIIENKIKKDLVYSLANLLFDSGVVYYDKYIDNYDRLTYTAHINLYKNEI